MFDRPYNRKESRAFVADMQRARYLAWRKQVGTFMSSLGFRCELIHVEDGMWASRFSANEDAFSAVLDELEHIGP